MSTNLRGITSPDLTKIVRSALHGGWQWVGYTGTTHAVIQWPETGEKVTFGTTPGVASWKTTATEIEKISGLKVWHKGNKKKSRRAFKPSGFDLYAKTASSWSSDLVDELYGQLHAYTKEFVAIADQDHQSRADVSRAAWLLRRIKEIETQLVRYHQPIDPFDPVSV